MQVKLLQHMTYQINQKIYSPGEKRESGKLPFIQGGRNKGLRRISFWPDTSEALLKASELLPLDIIY